MRNKQAALSKELEDSRNENKKLQDKTNFLAEEI